MGWRVPATTQMGMSRPEAAGTGASAGLVRTAEKQWVEKLLEDAGIKLDVVASDLFGVSGRAMLAALIAGQRDPTVLAGNRYLARALGEAAVNAGRTHTFLGERYRRLARRRGKKKAIVAVGRSILELAAAESRHGTVPGIGGICRWVLRMRGCRAPSSTPPASWTSLRPPR